MGCHTWCFARLPLSAEQVYQLALDEVGYRKLVHPKDKDTWMCEEQILAKDDVTISDFATQNYTRLHRGHASYSYVTKLLYMELHYVDDGKYGLHDPFRVSGYPDDECHSLQETLDFIARYETEKPAWITTYPDTNKYLLEFWARYPNGMITFG